MPEEASDHKNGADDADNAEDAQPISTGTSGSVAQSPVKPSNVHAKRPAHAPAFAFLAANRPMDSRIPEACANSFVGINLNSTPSKASDSSTQSFPGQSGVQRQSASTAPATRPHPGTGQAHDNNAPPSQPRPSGTGHASSQSTSQTPVFCFTPGVHKKAAEGRTSRVSHDGVRLATNFNVQLDLEAPGRSEPTAAAQPSEPVTDLPLPQDWSQPQPGVATTATAPGASGQDAAAAAKQTGAAASRPSASQQPFVFGAGQSAAAQPFASETDSNSGSQAQARQPFVFGAAAQASSAAPAAGTAQQQQHQAPANAKFQWSGTAPASKGPIATSGTACAFMATAAPFSATADAFSGAFSGFTANPMQRHFQASMPQAAATATSSAPAFAQPAQSFSMPSNSARGKANVRRKSQQQVT